MEQGNLIQIKGISHASSDLQNAQVAERQAKAAEISLGKFKCPVSIRAEYNITLSTGSGIALWAIFSKDPEEIDIRNPIRIGADSLGERGMLLANLEEALGYSRELSRGTENQATLFGLMADKESLPKFRLKEAPEATLEEKLIWEKELLGLYISGHPLEKFREKFSKHDQAIKKIKENETSGSVIVAGIIDEVKIKFTKNGTKMAFAKLTDFTGSIELVAFPDSYGASRNFLHKNNCVVVRGSISHRSGQPSIIVEKVKLLEA